MQLIVVRHARAKERDDKRFPDDTLRPLSGSGHREFAKFARRLPRWQAAPSLVLASRWSRAWETARILQEEARWPAPQRCTELETEGGFAAVEALLRLIRMSRTADRVALVGHEPSLGDLITRLLGASERAVALDKGAVALLELSDDEPVRAELRALVSPDTQLKRRG
ncbi:MAG: histidine phosphatase family protein [Planctomycetes bacterium]|nr:histidine phosphatase family protein [Planctomycetota bacterium]